MPVLAVPSPVLWDLGSVTSALPDSDLRVHNRDESPYLWASKKTSGLRRLAREYGHTLGGGGGSMGVPEPVPAACTLPPHAARTRELQNRGKDTLPREPGAGGGCYGRGESPGWAMAATLCLVFIKLSQIPESMCLRMFKKGRNCKVSEAGSLRDHPVLSF